jgi:hypothetical protein
MILPVIGRMRFGCLILLAVTSSSSWAESRWPDDRAAGVFQCHADFPLEPHTNLLEELARLQRDLVRTLGVSESREPIHLFLFEQKLTYESYLQLHYPQVTPRRAMFIKPPHQPGQVFAFRSADFEIDVRHEATHAVLHADLPMVPLWLDEGLAEYFEVPYSARAYEHPHFKAVKFFAHTRIGKVPDLDHLEQLRDLSQMGASEYRQAWAWVHFMLHGSSVAHDELLRFLSDIRAQTPPGPLSQRLRRRIPDLEQSFAEHFRQWKR